MHTEARTRGGRTVSTPDLLWLSQHLALTPIPLKPWLRRPPCLPTPVNSSDVPRSQAWSHELGQKSGRMLGQIVGQMNGQIVKWLFHRCREARSASAR